MLILLFTKQLFTTNSQLFLGVRILVIICFLIACGNTYAQFLDSIKQFVHSKPSIDARLESRFSFINLGKAKISGVRLGVTFKKKLKFGAGYSWLDDEVFDVVKLTDDSGQQYNQKTQLKFGYGCLYTDFVFHKTKRWQLSVPLQAGIGAYYTTYFNELSNANTTKRLLLIYEPGISIQFKIFKWLGVGSDVAYRFTLRNTKYIGNKLNSPTYAFKLLIWFDEIFYMTFPKHKLTKRFGPASW